MYTELASQISTSQFSAASVQVASINDEKRVTSVNAETKSGDQTGSSDLASSLRVRQQEMQDDQQQDKVNDANLMSSTEQALNRQQEDALLDKNVKMMDEGLRNLRNELKFSTDEDSGRTVVKVVNTDTEEVIRQIPREDFLAMSSALELNAGQMKFGAEQLKGSLLSEQA